MQDQLVVWFILGSTLTLFIWGRWRLDLVALIALLASVLSGVVAPKTAFLGFGEPAVITVALVLVVGKGLMNSGIITSISYPLIKIQKFPFLQLAGFMVLITFFSGFMNNIGALAILMPVAMTACREGKTSPSQIMMPLAFGSLLGGMTTMIGTPPNIIISSYRQTIMGQPFSIFDFSPVGIGVALAGVAFILILGWRLIPSRKNQASPEEMYEIEGYLAQAVIPKRSKMAGKTIEELENIVKGDIVIRGILRKNKRVTSTSRRQILKGGDVLEIEADTESLKSLLHKTGIQLVSADSGASIKKSVDEDMTLEVVVPYNAPIIKKAPNMLRLRHRFDISLLAVARHGRRIRGRFSNMKLQQGDVLLMKGAERDLADAVSVLGCFPLAQRGVRLEASRFLAGAVPFLLGLVAAGFGVVPIHVAFLAVVIFMILAKLISLREAYNSIDWSIIVLLGALIPIGQAFETTGAAESVSSAILYLKSYGSPTLMLGVVLVVTMFLSDIVNNAAAAILMAPIAVNVAHGLNASIDPFLMSVAIGASCAFLTPVGHQSNAMVMGPGGYKFSDYWRLGLPLEILITIVTIPLIKYFWPL